ncbi:MAG TPA: MBL fold metallo-hydrolase [Bacteriovoracaceae bacterium]|nr:MBL fold metallo-hydrolase [Bacteriovoracaceae bacterium]
MFKTLFFTAALLLNTSGAGARVELRWLTGATVLLEDGKSSILFDPAFTRPQWTHWLNLDEFRSDVGLVQEVLEHNKIGKLDGIFSSHSHFDHVVDAPMVSKLTGAIFYTDKSSEIISRAYKDPTVRTKPFVSGEKIRLGEFTVTPFQREHSKILHLIPFLPGEVPESFAFGFYDYHVGSTWFYLIEHASGKILLDQASEPYLELLAKVGLTSVDVLIQGISNRRDDGVVLEGYVKHLKPKLYVPNHFDNFFQDFNDGAESLLPGIGMEELLTEMRNRYPQLNVVVPKYGQKIELMK